MENCSGQVTWAPASIRRCWQTSIAVSSRWSFREEGHFHEAVTNRILDDLVAAAAPRRMTVVGDFMVRGGIHTVVTAEYPG